MKGLWQALLQLKQASFDRQAPCTWLSFAYREQDFGCWFDQWGTDFPREDQIGIWWDDGPCPDASHPNWVQIRDLFRVELHLSRSVSTEERSFLQYYLPYSLLPLAAHRLQRAISVSHFAQTLDGKIATESGDSRWIGNPENLIHAHRMRALCDGILIGAQTLHNDQPSLTVRHVAGENPRRIVVGSSAKDFDCLWESSDDPILLVRKEQELDDERLSYVRVPSHNGRLNCLDILRCLYRQEGIAAVYIEGGAQTTSYFLQDEAVDIAQLHLSPQVFGSGISAIQLPEIEKVKEALVFEPFQIQPVGDSVMFVGQLKRK